MCSSIQQYVENSILFKRTMHPSISKNNGKQGTWSLLLPFHSLFYCSNLCLYVACLKKSTEKASVERKAFNLKLLGCTVCLKEV